MKRMTPATGYTSPICRAATVAYTSGVIPPAAMVDWPMLGTIEPRLEELVREALTAGTSLRETSQQILALLEALGDAVSLDDVQRWMRAHALSLT